MARIKKTIRDFEAVGVESITLDRRFDMSRVIPYPRENDIKAALEKWSRECESLGLHTHAGCVVPIPSR